MAQLGPMFAKEMLETSRRLRFYLLRTALCLLILAAVFEAAWSISSGRGVSGAHRLHL